MTDSNTAFGRRWAVMRTIYALLTPARHEELLDHDNAPLLLLRGGNGEECIFILQCHPDDKQRV